jgi:hypothetical protein
LEQRKDEIKDELKNGSKNEKLLIEIKEVNDSINWLKKII